MTDREIYPKHLYFMMPCSDLLLFLFNPIGLKIGEKVGPKNSIVLSTICELISLSLLIFVPNYYVVLLAMCIFGIGISLNSIITIKNCWKFYPDKKGLMNGINVGSAGISTTFFTPVADFIFINPDKESTDTSGLYPEHVAKRITTYLYFLVVIFIVCGILSYLLTFNYDDIVEKSELSNTIDDNNEERISDLIKQSNVNATSTKILLKAFITKNNLQMCVFCVCGPCKYKIIFIKNFFYSS